MYNTINWENAPSTKTPITAQNLRHMDNQILQNAKDIEELKKETTYKMVGTLFAGDTEVVFKSDKISGNGTYQVNSSVYTVIPTDVVATDGQVTATFEEQLEDVGLELRFWEEE